MPQACNPLQHAEALECNETSSPILSNCRLSRPAILRREAVLLSRSSSLFREIIATQQSMDYFDCDSHFPIHCTSFKHLRPQDLHTGLQSEDHARGDSKPPQIN